MDRPDVATMPTPTARPDRLWNRLAKGYDRHAHEDEALAEAADAIVPYLAPDHRVLDFACGTGALSFRLAGHVREVVGLDTSERMIALAREHTEARGVTNVRFTNQDLFDEALGAEPFDVVLAFNIFHLVDEEQRFMERLARLLVPGGLFVSETPCLGEAGFVQRRLLPLVSKVGLLSHLRPLTFEGVLASVRAAGFDVVEEERGEAIAPSLFLVGRLRPLSRGGPTPTPSSARLGASPSERPGKEARLR